VAGALRAGHGLPARLLSPDACTIENACNATALQQALQHVSLKVDAAEGEKAGGCARYAVGAWQTPNWTGGPCFSASVEYVVRNRADPAESRTVAGTINEARHMHFAASVGQRWDGADSGWLCLDGVDVLSPAAWAEYV